MFRPYTLIFSKVIQHLYKNLTYLRTKILFISQKLMLKFRSQLWRAMCSSLNESSIQTEVYNKLMCIKGYRAYANYIGVGKANELLRNLVPAYVIRKWMLKVNVENECLWVGTVGTYLLINIHFHKQIVSTYYKLIV